MGGTWTGSSSVTGSCNVAVEAGRHVAHVRTAVGLLAGQDMGDTVVKSFLPRELASRFSVVFEQDGYKNSFNRRYRFEVHSDTTFSAFQAGLKNVRFAKVVTVPQ